MKKIITLSLSVVAIALIMLSCKKHDGASPTPYAKPDSLIFGRFNPASATPVRGGQLYLLNKNALYAYPTMYVVAGNPTVMQQLPDSLYVIAKYLIDNFPAYLMQHPNDTVIGCPGCSGERTIMLSVPSGTATKYWQINTDTSKLPIELRQYIWKAGVIIDKL